MSNILKLQSLSVQLYSESHDLKLARCLFVCWSLTSLCHSNGHIETMPAREINPFTALTRIRSQLLRTHWSTSNHCEWTQLRVRPLSHRGWQNWLVVDFNINYDWAQITVRFGTVDSVVWIAHTTVRYGTVDSVVWIAHTTVRYGTVDSVVWIAHTATVRYGAVVWIVKHITHTEVGWLLVAVYS